MSRREQPSSDSRRHRSRFDREPSPKRSKRDGKPETERPQSNYEFDKDRLDQDQKHHRRLHDAGPLESLVARDLKVETRTTNKNSENKSDELQEGTLDSSRPTKLPQSQSYLQHDDRGSGWENGRSSARKTDKERGWWIDPKEQQTDRAKNTMVESIRKQKDNREDNRAWRHDGYFEMESNPKPVARKRPSFREQKLPANSEKPDQAAPDPIVSNPRDRAMESGRRDERGHTSRPSDKYGRPFSGQRETNRAEAWKGRNSSSFRDRDTASGNYRGRDKLNTGQGFQPTGGRVDKWKHDLYDEANKSPTPKSEEDHISKIEALLAS